MEEINFQERERLKELAVIISLGSGSVYSKEGYRALRNFLEREEGQKELAESDADQLNKLL